MVTLRGFAQHKQYNDVKMEKNVTTQLGFDECKEEMSSFPLILGWVGGWGCVCMCESWSGHWCKERRGARCYLGFIFINTDWSSLLDTANFGNNFEVCLHWNVFSISITAELKVVLSWKSTIEHHVRPLSMSPHLLECLFRKPKSSSSLDVLLV